MDIVVLVKSIPDPNGDVVLGDDFLVNREGEGALDPGDEYAVEAALQLAEAGDGVVTVVSMGPAGAVSAIRRALSMGAHGAVVTAGPPSRSATVMAGTTAICPPPEITSRMMRSSPIVMQSQWTSPQSSQT